MEKKEFKITVSDEYIAIHSLDDDFAYQWSEDGEIGLLESNSDDESQCNYMSHICDEVHQLMKQLTHQLELIKSA